MQTCDEAVEAAGIILESVEQFLGDIGVTKTPWSDGESTKAVIANIVQHAIDTRMARSDA